MARASLLLRPSHGTTLNLAFPSGIRVAHWLVIAAALFTAAAQRSVASLARRPEPLQEATVRVSTELVVVDALVERKRDRLPIRSLGRDDFEIYEDGVRQPIGQSGLDSARLSIVFLFDLMDSVRPVLERLARGALSALGHLKADDEIAVMLYASRADLVQGFTKDHDRVARAIESAGAMRPGHCGREPELCGLDAYFNEAIYQAATVAEETRTAGNRPVIIWLTDNVPNIPPDTVHSEADALNLLRLTGVGVSVLLEHSGQSIAAATLYSRNPMLMFNRQRHPPGEWARTPEKPEGSPSTPAAMT